MNAKLEAPVKPHLAPSAERRRAIALRDHAVALTDLALNARAKTPTLGNRAAYLALREQAEKLAAEMRRVERLADEFLELAQLEEAEEIAHPDDAEDRWNREHGGEL